MKNTLKMHYSLPSGETAYFNTSKLKSILLRKSLESEKEGKKRSQQALMMDIADKIGVSSSAIKHWMLGHNAPSDLEKVTDLADGLGVDMMDLLDTEKENAMNTNTASTCTDNQFTTDQRLEMMKIFIAYKQLQKDRTNDQQDRKETKCPGYPIDYSSEKSVVRSIYHAMVDYLEELRFGISDYEYEAGSHFDTNGKYLSNFIGIHTALEKAKLDIPAPVFKQLYDFTINFLQLIPSFISYEFEIFFVEECSEIGTLAELWDLYIDTLGWNELIYIFPDFNSETFAQFESMVTSRSGQVYDDSELMVPMFLLQAAYDRLDEILKDYIK